MLKQLCFLNKRPDITMEQFIAYYENSHSQLSARLGAPPPRPNVQRYVRRYITAVPNPLTGEVIHPGYDCIMEMWWNSRADYEAAMTGLRNPQYMQQRLDDGLKLFATNSSPVCIVDERDSPVGPNNLVPQWIATFET